MAALHRFNFAVFSTLQWEAEFRSMLLRSIGQSNK